MPAPTSAFFVSYAQNFEDVILWRALRHIRYGRYIDIGAADPKQHSVSYSFYLRGWRGVHVEPLPQKAAALRQARPDEIVLETAIGTEHGATEFYEVGDGLGLSTCAPEISEAHRKAGWDLRSFRVPCRPLSSILDEHGQGEVHWLKIDVEGFEHEVISSWLPSATRPWVVVVESVTPTTQLPCHHSWDAMLVALGYRFVYFDGLNRFYISEAHPELASAFALPPNVFDHFKLACNHDLVVAPPAQAPEAAPVHLPLLLRAARRAGGIILRGLVRYVRERPKLRAACARQLRRVKPLHHFFVCLDQRFGTSRQATPAPSPHAPSGPPPLEQSMREPKIEDFVPNEADTPTRVLMTTGCRDSDAIPKVSGAGEIRTEANGTAIQIMHNGLKVLARGYHGDWMAQIIRQLRGHHEPQEERLFDAMLRVLPRDARMLELGGFWAYYTLWFMKDMPERCAVVLEPDPAHLAVGQQNATLNGLAPTFLSGVAAAKDGSPEPFATEQSGLQDLPRYSVAGIMDQVGFPHLDLLHCDIQGAETEILESCRPLFRAGRIDWVCVSTHAHQISGDPLTHQRCLHLLSSSGAIIEAEYDVHESFSGDGFILARFGPAYDGWRVPPISRNRYSTSLFRNPLYELALLQRQSRDDCRCRRGSGGKFEAA